MLGISRVTLSKVLRSNSTALPELHPSTKPYRQQILERFDRARGISCESMRVWWQQAEMSYRTPDGVLLGGAESDTRRQRRRVSLTLRPARRCSMIVGRGNHGLLPMKRESVPSLNVISFRITANRWFSMASYLTPIQVSVRAGIPKTTLASVSA